MCLWVIASGPYWRLRDYGSHETSQSLLIVAAPVKRPYIWDLAPSVSAIRYCLREGLHVHLLEWLPASRHTSNNGLDECTAPMSVLVAEAMSPPLTLALAPNGEQRAKRSAGVLMKRAYCDEFSCRPRPRISDGRVQVRRCGTLWRVS